MSFVLRVGSLGFDVFFLLFLDPESCGYSCMMGNFQVCAQGFELRASEGRVIICFYLLRIAHDGNGGEDMVN